MASYAVNIRTAVITQAVSALTTYPVCYPNQRFDVPNNSPWLKFSLIMPSDIYRQGLRVRDKLTFMAQIDVYTPKGSGDLVPYQVKDETDSGFPIDATPMVSNGQNVYVTYIGMPKRLPIGDSKDDAWDRHVIEIGMYAFVDRS